MEKFSGRIPSLDGLRTISIGLVLIGHFLHSVGLIDSFFLGNLGVRVFFVISGFLITGLLIKELEKTETINLSKFYFRRTLRIFPPYYFFLLVLLALTLLGFLQVPLSSFFPAFAYFTNYSDPQTWHLGHTWSLSVEEQFYLIFPGLLFIFGIRKAKILLLFIILISPIIRYADMLYFGDTRWLGMGFHYYMDALGIGCLLALCYSTIHANSYYQKLLKSKLVFLLPPFIIFLNVQGEHPLIHTFACSLMNLSIAFCLDWAVTNHQTLTGKILNSAPMVTIGTMSYSIYLWQQPFFSHSGSMWTQLPFNLLGVAATSLISYYLIEKGSLKLRQYVENRWFKEKAKDEPKPLTYPPSLPVETN